MRTKKAFKNIVSSLIYQIVGMICGLITPRLILASFGSTYNGVVTSATQFLSIISILTLGITASTRVALYKTLADKNILGTSRIVKATQNYMRKVALCVAFYALALCFIYPAISHNDLSYKQNAILILIVSIGTFAEYFFGITNTTLLTADQSGYIIYIINILKTISNTILVAILIRLGCTIYVVKLGSSIVFLLSPLVLSIFVKRKYHLDTRCQPDNTAIKQRGAVAIHQIANIIHNDVDLVILTVFTDAKLISVYMVYYLVIGKIKNIMQVFTNGMEAAFGDMWVKKQIQQLKQNFRAYEYMLYCFTSIVFSCVGMLILPFVNVYTHGVNDINYIRIDLAILISFAEGMYCIRHPYLTLVQATGSYEETKKGAVVEAALNLILSIILVGFIGINGVIIGTLVANIFRTTQYTLFISKRILNRSIKEIGYRMIWLLTCCGIIVTICIFINNGIKFPTTWLGWFKEATITFSIAVIITLIMSLIFYPRDFIFLANIGKRMLKK